MHFVFYLYHRIDEANCYSYSSLPVNTSTGATLYPFQEDSSFCCGPGNSTSNQCISSTLGSSAPFPIEAGRVIFNRTSGSTSPNNSEISTVTIISTITPIPIATSLSGPNGCHASPSPSNEPTAVGLGVGLPLGLALLGSLGLLWRQRTHELSAKKESCAWQEKYDELKTRKRRELTRAEGETHELGHGHWRPDELDGRLVHEMAGSMRQGMRYD